MVSISSSFTVIPSEATPNCSLLLSETEQINAPTHALNIYVYKPNHKPILNETLNMIDPMRDSLAKILVHFYPLAGRLHMIKGGRLKVECNAKGVKLLEAESTRALDDYGDFEPNDTIKELLPDIDYTEPIEELPLLLVQFTRFTCGGFCVGVAVSSVIVDGISGTHFINSWAKLARGCSLEEDDMPFLNKVFPKSDSLKFLDPKPDVAPSFDHKEFKPLPLVLGHSDTTEESKKETSLAIMKLTREMVEKLKKKANEFIENGCRPYSRYESISAYIWRCVCKARNGDHNQPTLVYVVAGARNRLKPPLPLNYFGNATYPTVTPTCLMGDIVSKPLSYVAQKIREATEGLSDEYLRSGFEFIGRQSDLGWLRGNYQNGKMESPFLGNPNINIWSWMTNMPLYGPDFGSGRPLYMGPGIVRGDGKAIIMPGAGGDGSVSIVICLQTVHIEAFKEFFYKDI